ncbi:MAG: ADOP family duplicated permease [Psychrosphaera sp.]|nr:ADOP family duplicated permease [Psychrosphaera sp.]
MLSSLSQDIQFGLGQFYRRPKFMISIMLCLALGMGPNTALFSLINELLFATINVEQPERLVSIGYTEGSGEREMVLPPTSHRDYLYISQNSKTLKGSFATSISQVSLMKDEKASLIVSQMVSSSYFDVLGRAAQLGKTFDVPDEFIIGREPFVVLSQFFWQQKYQSDSAIIGNTLSLNGYDFKVIGVMPADFEGNAKGMIPDIWVPLAMAPQLRPDEPDMITDPNSYWLQFYARLADGQTMASATTELAALSKTLVSIDEESMPRSFYAAEFETYGILPQSGLKYLSAALMFIGSLILLLACASVAALLLARATERRQEMAVRLAMGASRWNIVRQLLVEGLLLSLASGAVALIMTLWIRKSIMSLIPDLPVTITLSMPIDGPVIGYVVLIATIATLLFGLAPALQATKFDIMPALKDQPVAGSFEQSTSRWRSFFLVTQFTLSIALLISAGVAIHSMQKATEVDPGFESQNVVVFRTLLSQYGFHGEEKEDVMQRLKSKFNDLEGVEEVGIARAAPFAMDRTGTIAMVFDENAADTANALPQRINYVAIDQDYFSSLDIELLKGRNLSDEDRDYLSPVTVLNQAAAKLFFGEVEAVGKYLQISGDQDAYEVIGIVETVKNGTLGEDDKPFVYLPLEENVGHAITLIMRTSSDPQFLVDSIKTAISEVEPVIALEGISTMSELIAFIQLPLILIAALCGGLGVLALILAIVGVYGSVAYSIQLRQQEVGVRLALGATPNQLIWMLLKKGLLLALIGTVFGIALAFGITSVMSIVLVGPAQDPAAFIGVPLLLLAVSTAAILIPARRTSYREPMAVLRYE